MLKFIVMLLMAVNIFAITSETKSGSKSAEIELYSVINYNVDSISIDVKSVVLDHGKKSVGEASEETKTVMVSSNKLMPRIEVSIEADKSRGNDLVCSEGENRIPHELEVSFGSDVQNNYQGVPIKPLSISGDKKNDKTKIQGKHMDVTLNVTSKVKSQDMKGSDGEYTNMSVLSVKLIV